MIKVRIPNFKIDQNEAVQCSEYLEICKTYMQKIRIKNIYGKEII